MTTKKKKEIFLDIYKKAFANISAACEKAKISRQTFYNWRKEDDNFNEKIEEISEGLIDFAESILHNNIRNGRTAELIFFLKTKAKKRGYTEQVIISEDSLPSGFELTDIT